MKKNAFHHKFQYFKQKNSQRIVKHKLKLTAQVILQQLQTAILAMKNMFAVKIQSKKNVVLEKKNINVDMKLLNNLNAINKSIINAVQLMYNFGQD